MVDPVNIDAVILAVLQSGLTQVCNEIDRAFVRSAFSPGIAEALDRSDGIYHLDAGGIVPGGFSANATGVEPEGLRLLPVKLYKRGVLDDKILQKSGASALFGMSAFIAPASRPASAPTAAAKTA